MAKNVVCTLVVIFISVFHTFEILPTQAAATAAPYQKMTAAKYSKRRPTASKLSSNLKSIGNVQVKIAETLDLLKLYSPETTETTCVQPHETIEPPIFVTKSVGTEQEDIIDCRVLSDNGTNASCQKKINTTGRTSGGVTANDWKTTADILADEPGQEKKALHAYVCALITDSMHVDAWINVATILNAFAMQAQNKTALKHAHKFHLAAVSINPRHAGALFSAGVSAAQSIQNQRQSQQHFSAIVQLPLHHNLTASEWYLRGDALAKLGDAHRGYESFRKACTLAPDHAGYAHRVFKLGTRLGYADELRLEYLGSNEDDDLLLTHFLQKIGRLDYTEKMTQTYNHPGISGTDNNKEDNIQFVSTTDLRLNAKKYLSAPFAKGVLQRSSRLRSRLQKYFETEKGRHTCEVVAATSQVHDTK